MESRQIFYKSVPYLSILSRAQTNAWAQIIPGTLSQTTEYMPGPYRY